MKNADDVEGHNAHISYDILLVQEGIKHTARRSHAACQSLLCSAVRLRLKCDGTRAETRFRLSAKRTSPFKSAGEGGPQFSRLLAAEVCSSAEVMLDTPCSEVV